jgi:hypothetical protein
VRTLTDTTGTKGDPREQLRLVGARRGNEDNQGKECDVGAQHGVILVDGHKGKLTEAGRRGQRKSDEESQGSDRRYYSKTILPTAAAMPVMSMGNFPWSPALVVEA